jgi:hypothetical protein
VSLLYDAFRGVFTLDTSVGDSIRAVVTPTCISVCRGVSLFTIILSLGWCMIQHIVTVVIISYLHIHSIRMRKVPVDSQAGGGATAVGRGTEVKTKAADTLKSLDDVMAQFCVRDEATRKVKLLHELPTIVQHRGKWAQVRKSSAALVSCSSFNVLEHTLVRASLSLQCVLGEEGHVRPLPWDSDGFVLLQQCGCACRLKATMSIQ